MVNLGASCSETKSTVVLVVKSLLGVEAGRGGCRVSRASGHFVVVAFVLWFKWGHFLAVDIAGRLVVKRYCRAEIMTFFRVEFDVVAIRILFFFSIFPPEKGLGG